MNRKRLVFFSSLLVVSIVGFALALLWVQSFLGSSMNDMMAQMMSGQPINSSSSMMPFSSFALFWLVFLGLPILIAVGVFGVAYYIAFPELPVSGASTISSPVPPRSALPVAPPQSPASIVPAKETSNEERNRMLQARSNTSWSALMKASTPEERKVLEVLTSHDGRYLQKQIVKESSLSKLKTHRIIARFAQRGMVSVRRQGNTNEIVLSDWLLQESETNTEGQKQQQQW